MRIVSPGAIGAVALALGGLWVPAAQATTYRIVDLGTMHFPTGLNDRGEVSGILDRYLLPHKPLEATVLRHGHWRALPESKPCPRCGTAAYAINDGGDIVGASRSAPAFWPRGGGFMPVPVPPASTGDGKAVDISDNQVIAGLYFTSPGDAERCFRWSAAEGSVGLGLMGNGDFCYPAAINNAGQIVGGADIEPFGVAHAFVFDNGAFLDLGTVDGVDTYATDINRQGHVVFGNYYTSFLWKNGHTIDLRAGTPYSSVYTTSLNDHDELVGQAVDDMGGHVVLISHGHFTDLEPEVEGLGDWHLSSASLINNLGVIVGNGLRADGLVHYYMLVPLP
jgi:probable HAF family extracellular repeat protein